MPRDTRKPGGTTLGQRPRHPSGSPLRNWDSIRGTMARSLRSPREGKSERVAQHCVRPSIVTGRDAGGGPGERRAGRRAPHCRKGRARQQRSRPDPLTFRSFSGRYLHSRAISTYLSKSRGAILEITSPDGGGGGGGGWSIGGSGKGRSRNSSYVTSGP